MRIGRKHRKPELHRDPEIEIKNAITGFRQRIQEDPEFKDSLLTTLRGMVADDPSIPRNLAESTQHAAAYGDNPDRKKTDAQHVIRGRAFNGILDLVTAIADGSSEQTTEEILDGIRHEIGYLASEVYYQAQTDPPDAFLNGAVARYYSGFGTLARLEHVRGVEGQIEEITRGLDDPEA